MKITLFTVLLLASISAFSSDTIHVKKVFLNGKAIKVKSGYIIHKSKDTWEVNGKEVKLHVYRPTEKPDFKPKMEEDTLVTNK